MADAREYCGNAQREIEFKNLQIKKTNLGAATTQGLFE